MSSATRRWIVFFDRPYYPSVQGKYDTEDQATAAALKLVNEETDTTGEHDSTIYVAQIMSRFPVKTTY